MSRRKSALDRAFAVLEAAAANGDRCPKSAGDDAHPALRQGEVGALARAGKIHLYVYAHNFRKVKILTGPHAGKETSAPPNPKWLPYKSIGPAAGVSP